MDRAALLNMFANMPTPPQASGPVRALPTEQRRAMLTALGKMMRTSLDNSPIFGDITDEDIETVVKELRRKP